MAANGKMALTLDMNVAFSISAFVYCGAFAAVVWWTSESVAVKQAAVVLLTLLPALLYAELVDAARAVELLRSCRAEFVGTAVMVVLTCGCGPAVGHLGLPTEWLSHLALMAVADWVTGSPQVNPGVTTALMLAGGHGVTPATWLTNVPAQVGGALLGWRILLAGGSHLAGSVGGPSPNLALPRTYLMACEFTACWTLLAAVFVFATTAPFAGAASSPKLYAFKMALINASLRLIIVTHGATGPAVNAALATAYAAATRDEWPTLDEPHFYVYWIGGLGGAAAMGLAWRVVKAVAASGSIGSKPNQSREAFKIAAGLCLATLGLSLWHIYLGPEGDAIVQMRILEASIKKQHPIAKFFKRRLKL